MPDVAGDALLLRLGAAMVAAAVAAVLFDRATAARGLDPPGFASPWRRGLALVLLATVFAVALFSPLASIGLEREPLAPADVRGPALFLLQGIFVVTVLAWYALGYTGTTDRPLAGFARQFGLRVPRGVVDGARDDDTPADDTPPGDSAEDGRAHGEDPSDGSGEEEPGRETPRREGWVRAVGREVAIGLGAGAVGWGLSLVAMIAAVSVLVGLGYDDLVPTEPPQAIPLIAGLPILTRIAIAFAAGTCEELFFRGFLQPRIGILASTAFFALGHLSYEQPLMLVGITVLSLLFAGLVVWRRNIVAAVVAHTAFDLVQLLVVVPMALRALDGAS